MYPEPEAVKRQRKDCRIFERIKDWTDGEIEAAIDATSDATEVDLEAAFGGTAEEIVI